MGRITVHAGDFVKGNDHFFNFGSFTLKTDVWQWLGETISSEQLVSAEVASEESVKKLGSTVAWGAVGALALGPLGLLAGVLAGLPHRLSCRMLFHAGPDALGLQRLPS